MSRASSHRGAKYRLAALITTCGSVVSLTHSQPLDAEDTSPPVMRNSIGMEFVTIPAGQGVVGSPEDEPGRDRDEPRREVRFASAFLLGKHEVTQQQYQQVTKSNPSAFSASGDWAERVHGIDTSRFPVESVSWHDAVAFCDKLSALPAERAAHRSYRLPTETEWEYAARGGRAATWHFGDDPSGLGEYAWYGRDRAENRPHSVAAKRSNPWGLHDIYGNVWEWCGDPKEASHLPKKRRAIRGGSWFSTIANCRSATRVFDPEEVRDPDTGFRVIVEIVSPEP